MITLEESALALNDLFQHIDHSSAGQVAKFLTDFSNTVSAWEKDFGRSAIVGRLQTIREAAAASPFLYRAQQWPRGYAGDFETIDYILTGINKAMPSTFAYHIEHFFLQSAVCEQHRNKVAKQALLVQEALSGNPSANILSIGCGTSEDIYRCIPQINSSACHITLVDIDEDALAFSVNKLQLPVSKLTTIHGNIYKNICRLNNCYDLILIGGVFDYLKDHVIIALLKALSGLLNADGRVFFTNIATGNPYRIFMEYLADWMLIERTEEDIMRLIEEAGTTSPYEIGKDSTGLTFMVTIGRNGPNYQVQS